VLHFEERRLAVKAKRDFTVVIERDEDGDSAEPMELVGVQRIAV